MAQSQNTLTQSELKAALDYNKETGFFTWRWRDDVDVETNRRLAGKRAGTINRSGNGGYKRIHIAIHQKKFAAHRLAWLYVYGAWPKFGIDHIDQNPTNNAIKNLRDVGQSCNLQNRSRTGGRYLRGVCKDPRRVSKPFNARVKRNRKTIWLGTFATEREAHEAYVRAVRDLYGVHAVTESLR